MLIFFLLSLLINITLIIYIGIIKTKHRKEVAKVVRIYEEFDTEYDYDSRNYK